MILNDSIEPIIQYIDQTGIKKGTSTYSRKMEQKYVRFYLFEYLRSRGFGYQKIADIFNMNHATIIHGIKSWNNLKRYSDVREMTEEVRFLFPMQIEQVCPSMQMRIVQSMSNLEKYMNKKMKKNEKNL